MLKEKLIEIAKEEYKDASMEVAGADSTLDYVSFINDIKNRPHALVLAGAMDRQIPYERAWQIPFRIYNELGSFDIDFLASVPLSKYVKIFKENSYHRFNEDMAKSFYEAVQLIKSKYSGDASNIWKGNLSSATIVSRFLEFKGIGIKIATMLTNILARDFHVKMSDYYSVDISPDVHVKRLMSRTGFLGKDPTPDMVIYKAREIYPEYPGIIDLSFWKIGREYCHPTNPECSKCPLFKECPKII